MDGGIGIHGGGEGVSRYSEMEGLRSKKGRGPGPTLPGW